MVGEGVLKVCLSHQGVEKILVINRTKCGISDPKLTEIIHNDFFELSPVEDQLTGYDACFHCIGITSPFVKEAEYQRITLDLTLSIAGRLSVINPGMVFCYVSGFGADMPGKAKFMQARIKGMTEALLFKLPFRKTYSFRPGLLKPLSGQKKIHKVYFLFNPLYGILRKLMPGFIVTLEELSLAMINAVILDYQGQIVEVKDIVKLAGRKI